MAEFDLNNSTTLNFKNTIPDFVVATKALDVGNVGEDTFWYFDKAPTHFGYLFAIPEVWSAASALATYTTQGWSTQNVLLRQELVHVVGYGKDSFSKMIWNHLVTKWIVGDSFIEFKRNKKRTVILNMLSISPERVRLVIGKNKMLKRYDVWDGRDWKPIKLEDMLHSQNKKIGDQIHGTSMLEPLIFAIDMKNEMMADERVIKHRDKAIGIAEFQTNNKGKITFGSTAISNAVKDGDMLGVSAGTVKILPWPSRGSEDRQAWVTYLEAFIYQNFGVRKGMITSGDSSEAGSKMDSVNFIPIHTKERKEMEEDLNYQQQVEVEFGEPANLAGLQQETEQKNTGQIGLQPNDVEASLTRE